MVAQFPSSWSLEQHEIYEVNRMRLALRFNRFPAELDAQPIRDIELMTAVMMYDEAMAKKEAEKVSRR